MKIAPILRVTGLVLLAYFLLETTLDTGDKYAIVEYPVIWLILAVILVFAIAIELSVGALENVLYKTLKPDAKVRYDLAAQQREENRFAWLKKTYNKLLDKKPLEKEAEIVLDHDYDGIRELDNNLPPWWLYGFYISIIFAVVYMANYHIFGGTSQQEEYEMEIAAAREAVEEYKRTAPDLIDENTVELLTGQEDIDAGKTIFSANCAACHKMDGAGGIGPNLVDDYWILGGGIKNVFHTIAEGGRAGKGMVSWKTDLKPNEMAQVASYVLSLHGTEPVDPKEPEGELWMDPDAKIDEADVDVVDPNELEMELDNTGREY
ncbi:cbb3-type cytochrome c oxidase N-terminal domain-containing protein [Salegentibacter sp. F188]|uniref:Cbb3-type cytochrome c oxidase N-terminal domain-containing protein n=1 Tax=Autumnicola patrickiae TaxID=3075591 RepID=A0ABU3E3Q4_9FLAO|nr:cbb3-type cytochrome c oxidase N-terminal domain-containing protein [Salegentibacter sp. F188]MDT0690620.1 cbb3-type cytochrome c oxidase N-terminal domain-containing protein [Salegentibacter sp. F188]